MMCRMLLPYLRCCYPVGSSLYRQKWLLYIYRMYFPLQKVPLYSYKTIF